MGDAPPAVPASDVLVIATAPEAGAPAASAPVSLPAPSAAPGSAAVAVTTTPATIAAAPVTAAAATVASAPSTLSPPAPAASASASPPAPDAAEPPPVAAADAPSPTADIARQDLWPRLRAGMRMPDLDNEWVRKWEQWYAGRPDYVQRMTERGSLYLFHIVEEVERRGLPAELALLPFIESAFNPQAISSARAAGMWQFMPATGKDFELRQNLFRDDRRDVLASTRAALDYLEQLYARFDDWALALAAYNWGPGNVQRAVDRNRRAGLAAGFENLQRLPQETREYVPKLQAVKNIVLRPDAFGLALPAVENHPYFLSVTIERDIDVVLAARLAGIEMDDFRELNPQHHKPVILAAGTPQVLLPYDNARRFENELQRHPGPLASWTAWVAPRTLKPADAARLVGMDEARLREVNRIPPRMLVKAGSTLVVPRAAHALADVPERIADFAVLTLAPERAPARRTTVRAGAKGESVAALARRYRVSPAQLAAWNDVAPGARFAAGQTVVVMLPARARAPTRVTAARPAKSAAAGKSQARRAPAARAPARVQVAGR